MDDYSSEYYWSKTIVGSRYQVRSNMRNSFKNYYYSEEAGVVWPRRYYACSFCKREFRCAQALGGHMNVHRRDRARLKQSQNEVLCQTKKPDKQSSAGSKSVIFSHLAYSPAIKELAGRKVLSPPAWLQYFPVGAASETIHSKRSIIVSPTEKYTFTTSDKVGSSMEDIDLELRLGESPSLK